MGDRSLPTGIVTFLLTDVVDSTALWDRDSELMERALARHDEIIEAAVKAYDGFLLKARCRRRAAATRHRRRRRHRLGHLGVTAAKPD